MSELAMTELQIYLPSRIMNEHINEVVRSPPRRRRRSAGPRGNSKRPLRITVSHEGLMEVIMQGHLVGVMHDR